MNHSLTIQATKVNARSLIATNKESMSLAMNQNYVVIVTMDVKIAQNMILVTFV